MKENAECKERKCGRAENSAYFGPQCDCDLLRFYVRMYCGFVSAAVTSLIPFGLRICVRYVCDFVSALLNGSVRFTKKTRLFVHHILVKSLASHSTAAGADTLSTTVTNTSPTVVQ